MSAGFQYAAGWIDTTIHDFLSDIDASPSISYALVTCLDSSLDVVSIIERNVELGKLHGRGDLTPLGNGFWLKTRHLLAIDRKSRLFFGFDELWLGSKTPSKPKPDDIIITGPDRITDQTLVSLSAWMRDNHCSLGLGDGTGMNFCAKLGGVAKYIVDALSAGEKAFPGSG